MTMDKIKPGQSAEMEVEVTSDLTINRTGKPGAEVLSTPSLLHLMELTSIEATDHLLPSGYTTVGFAVDKLRHLAPTSLGARVRIRSELTEVDVSKFTYSIEAFEGEKTIGVATHRRAAVPTDP